ncbi:MAG: hypothetical protein AAB768_03060 [Patescibacteria group bacterium]
MPISAKDLENIFLGTRVGHYYRVDETDQLPETPLTPDEGVIAVMYINCFTSTELTEPDFQGNIFILEVVRSQPTSEICAGCPANDVCRIRS